MQFDRAFVAFEASPRHHVVIAYDTPSAKRRQKLARATLGYARRVQRSVYEGDLNSSELRLLESRLRLIVHPTLDDLRIYRQCARCEASCTRLGAATPPPTSEAMIA